MSKLRVCRKPIVLDAEQFFPSKKPWPAGVKMRKERPYYGEGELRSWERIYYTETLEGEHIVTPEDWIVTDVRGERYPVKPHIFNEIYVIVKELK